jgi:malate dehydrogenase (oxaloacetate-decarboxylating)(NADP+)
MLINVSCVQTAETLAAQATQENFDKGSIFPPFTNIRKISALIAASVAAKAYELGMFSDTLAPLQASWIPSGLMEYLCLTLLKLFSAGLATRLPRPRDLEKYAESCMYTPVYRSYR